MNPDTYKHLEEVVSYILNDPVLSNEWLELDMPDDHIVAHAVALEKEFQIGE